VAPGGFRIRQCRRVAGGGFVGSLPPAFETRGDDDLWTMTTPFGTYTMPGTPCDTFLGMVLVDGTGTDGSPSFVGVTMPT